MQNEEYICHDCKAGVFKEQTGPPGDMHVWYRSQLHPFSPSPTNSHTH